MVGDSLRDIEAGSRLGMRTVLITGDDEAMAAETQRAAALATFSVASLPEFVQRFMRS